jgi:uncharacterized membrane protein
MRIKTIFRWLAALFFIAAGANHFRTPEIYVAIVPHYLPWPLALSNISGAAEMLGGLGILIPMTRRAAGWGLIALLAAVFPANIDMALHGFRSIPGWVLWLRLPFQFVFVAWVYWTSCSARSFEKTVSSCEPSGRGAGGG